MQGRFNPHGHRAGEQAAPPEAATEEENAPPQNAVPPRPKIGLALGGGVARGWAHIGVLRALNRLGIEPDIIAGASVGALVGAVHLAGKLDTLESWARSLTRRRMIGYLDVRLGGSGILGGQRLARLLRDHLDDLHIEDLPKRFVAVCTELATGHEIWLQDGPLTDALRASYALPGVFAPVKNRKRWLIDGALVNPVPISVCRALGARLVIGVTLSADAFGKSMIEETPRLDETEPDAGSILSRAAMKAARPDRAIMRQLFGTSPDAPGLSTVMLGALNIVMDRLSRSRMAGDPADILVSPRVGHIGLLDFDRAAESIALGEEALEREVNYLRDAMALLT
jgi:NTE family protein